MNVKENIGVHGKLTIKVIDGKTGIVIEEDSGDNVVLNSGLDFLRKNITTFTPVPVQYMQLGGDSTAATPLDTPAFPDGRLVIRPSELFLAKAYFLTPNTTLFKSIVNLNEGNGNGTATYTEAVLSFPVEPPPGSLIDYVGWFARKTFSGKTKTNNVLFELNWEITFKYVSA